MTALNNESENKFFLGLTLPLTKFGRYTRSMESSVVVGPYDTTKIVLLKYSLAREGTLPTFFRLLNPESVVPGNHPLEIEDFRVAVKVFKGPEKVESVVSLARSYGLGLVDAVCLWYLSGALKLEEYTFLYLRPFGSKDFYDKTRFERTIEEFKKRVVTIRGVLKEKAAKISEIVAEVGRPPKEGDEPTFFIDGEEIDFSITTKETYGLVDIFDAMSVSADLPFIWCHRKSNSFFKVWEGLIPPPEWYPYDKVPEASELVIFRVLVTPGVYAECVWYPTGYISVEYKIRKATEIKERIKFLIYESLEVGGGFDRPDRPEEGLPFSQYRLDGFEITTQRSVAISGIFPYRMNYNPYIMAWLISLDPVVTKYAYLNETENTEPRKKMFRLYLGINHSYDTREDMQLNIFPIPKDIEVMGLYNIRIRHCTDLLTARASIRLFEALYRKYEESYDEILSDYAVSALAKRAVATASVKKATDKNLKTKVRLLDLKKHDLKLFGAGYSGQCQSNKQPYIVALVRADGKIPTEVKELRAEFAKLTPRDANDKKIMEFEGAYYASERPGEKTTHKYPGLKRNTDKSVHGAEYREDYPCLPCSFINPKDYVTPDKPVTPGMCLDDAVRGGGGGSDGSYILETKPPNQGKFSSLPYNSSRLAGLLGVEKTIESKGERTVRHYPYLRFGVASSPQSFILALEAATNYDQYIRELDKIPIIRAAIKGMLENYAAGKQEFYDVTLNRLKKEWVSEYDENRYLEPAEWVGMAQAYYGVNIVMFSIEHGFTGDRLLLPRFAEAYLPVKIVRTKQTVVIFRQRMTNSPWPYQCAVMRMRAEPDDYSLFDTKEDKLVSKMVEMYEKSWKVYSVSPVGYFEYEAT